MQYLSEVQGTAGTVFSYILNPVVSFLGGGEGFMYDSRKTANRQKNSLVPTDFN